jgi:hypothetical protein
MISLLSFIQIYQNSTNSNRKRLQPALQIRIQKKKKLKFIVAHKIFFNWR